jgi:hypothetical protein
VKSPNTPTVGPSPVAAFWLWTITTALVSTGIIGCRDKNQTNMPKTYPVQGVVRYKSGQALKGGTIIFKSVDHPTLTITGEIKTDGSFTLVTLVDGKGKKVEGAPEGKHEIVVYPPSDENQMSEDITVLNPKQTVEPKENQCNVEIEKVRRR